MKAAFEIEDVAQQIRIDCLRMGAQTGKNGAHFGGGLSLAEIVAVLYSSVMSFHPDKPTDPVRDRLILSKGHGAMAYYAGLKFAGFINDDEMMTFKSDRTFLYGHPSMNVARGIEFSSGSLGLGLSLGVGTAAGLQLKGIAGPRVFVIMGDGECNEGSVWEAATSAAHLGLTRLVTIIDQNGAQYDGPTREILDMGDLALKWRSFGWDAVEVDGHDVNALRSELVRERTHPLALIARTVKGKGVSFMEGDPTWHHARLTPAQLEVALSEVGATSR